MSSGDPAPLRRRVALVTGSSRGIGRAIAIAFAREGASVVVNQGGNDEAGARETLSEIQNVGGSAVALSADLADPVACERLVEETVGHFGQIDVLVNNAGICPGHEFLDMPQRLWQDVQDVNYRATFLVSQRAARKMIEQGNGGRIIAISSISALVGGSLQSHYAPSKAAVASLMQSIAIPLGPHGITCNAVLPGAIETDLTRDGWRDPTIREALEARIPVGRVGTGADVAAAVVFLASDEARYVTGASLLVDGGLYANFQ